MDAGVGNLNNAGNNAQGGDCQKDKSPGAPGKSSSRTITDTIVGEHEHTIVGYSLIKGIGDGEPIASERFVVGGHEWVLLFYPDGKRSSSEIINPQQIPPPHAHLHAAAAAAAAGGAPLPPNAPGQLPPQPPGGGGHRNNNHPAGAPPAAGLPPNPPPAAAPVPQHHPVVVAPQQQGGQHVSTEYCALFVALIGETENPQGVINTSEGRVVRAFHRFTLVDQSGRGQDVTKGRRRDQGAVKISCARQDPNARNCHGYRKFVKRSLLEDPNRGLVVNDTIIIRYQIELVVSTGGALSRHAHGSKHQLPSIAVPPPNLGIDLATLLEEGSGTDVAFCVEDEIMPAHKILLQARSPVFKAMLSGPMMEGHSDSVTVHDVKAPVFRALLQFAYTDELPEELRGSKLEVAMAQHLLAAADRFQLIRLRCICEQRLCETVEVDTVATTLALAEQNNAKELKRVCLEFVSKHLQPVMDSEGYQHMISTCPQLQSELLQVIASTPPAPAHRSTRGGGGGVAPLALGHHPRDHGRAADESSTDGQLRRVRQRRE